MEARSSLERLIALLDLFTEARLEWTPDEMMAELGYSRPTLYRYLKTLKAAGFLTAMPSGRFSLGPRVVEMDFLMRKSDPLLANAQPVLDTLAAAYPCTVLVVRWYGHKLLCIASKCSAADAKTSYPRGRPMPLVRGAISRAIIAFLPRHKLLAVIDANLAALTQVGLGRDRETVLSALRQVRRAGYAVARGEVTRGVVGIAAPIFDGGNTPVGALGVTISRKAAERHEPARIGSDVLNATQRINEVLALDRAAFQADDSRQSPVRRKRPFRQRMV